MSDLATSFYPAQPAVSFDLPSDVEEQAADKIGNSGLAALKIVFQGLGLSQATATDILNSLLQNWKQIAARIVEANGQDAINFLTKAVGEIPAIPMWIKLLLAQILTNFGPLIVQAILAKLSA